MSDIISKLTEENYAGEIEQSEKLIIDFYADWCNPCKNMGPVFEAAANEYEGKIKFAKINIDEQRKLAIENNVMSIPTLLLFKEGKEVDRISGSLNDQQLKEKLQVLL